MFFKTLFIYLLYFTQKTYSFKILQHPLEPRAVYVYDCGNINKMNPNTLTSLKIFFKKHPLMIFKGLDTLTPTEFLNFVKQFDDHCDEEALADIDKFEHQLLQPFDRFPDAPHVAPRGNANITNYYNIKQISVAPSDHFVNHYLWHCDILGHEYKLPNVITAFHIIDQPVIGGDTDFISGETVYENLSEEQQKACKNILVEINRRKFVTKSVEMDYAGILRREEFIEQTEGTTQIPLVLAPNNKYENFRVMLMPSFFEKVVGWNVKESREWCKNFMLTKVLPHRISIQWKKGDVAIFNNRRFIHSSTPARLYKDNVFDDRRLLLQTFIPTKLPLLGVKPKDKDVYAFYNLKWITSQEKSIISTGECEKYAKLKIKENNGEVDEDGIYVIKQ